MPESDPKEAAADEPAASSSTEELRQLDLPGEGLQTLSVAKRQIGLRIVPYNVVAESRYGPLMFQPGAFGDVNPADVRLRMDHADPPTGLGLSFTDQPDAPHMEFRVSKTSRGDDQLALATDGVSRGASVGFGDNPANPPTFQKIAGRRVLVYGPDSANLHEVSTTWQPTFSGAGVTHVLSRDEKGTAPVAEAQEAPAGAVTFDSAPIIEAIRERNTEQDSRIEKVLGLFEQWREAQRRDFEIPGGSVKRTPKLYNWAEVAIRMMRGATISREALKELALDDVVTADNPGLVPDTFTADFDDLISSNRPFTETLRRVATPTTGLNFNLPKLTTRAVAGTQSGDKQDITGTVAPEVDLISFPYQTVVGGADIAMQILLRGDQSTFDLIIQELAEAYAFDFDHRMVDALLNVSVVAGPQTGGTIDPEDLTLGTAWQNSIVSYRRAPSHIWMNSAAVAAFIDAKDPTNNGPLYSQLAGSFTAAGGTGGTISGLTPVYVPALDDVSFGVDVIVGPARSFVWAEDVARRLQVDVPSKAGRDLALVGGLFAGPRFADAFTTFTLS